jgi:hypothetical protein
MGVQNMLAKVREILLTQYIGSILIALLGCQALVVLLTTAVRTGFWYFETQRRQSVLGEPSALFPSDTLILSGVTVAVYLLTAYALARWLYPAATLPPPEADSEPDQSE